MGLRCGCGTKRSPPSPRSGWGLWVGGGVLTGIGSADSRGCSSEFGPDLPVGGWQLPAPPKYKQGPGGSFQSSSHFREQRLSGVTLRNLLALR